MYSTYRITTKNQEEQVDTIEKAVKIYDLFIKLNGTAKLFNEVRRGTPEGLKIGDGELVEEFLIQSK